MDLDASGNADKTEDRVAIDGVTAAREVIIDTRQLAVNNKDVVLDMLLRKARSVEHKIRCTLCRSASSVGTTLLHVGEHIDNRTSIEFAARYLEVEITRLLEAKLTDDGIHHILIRLQLMVLQLALQHFPSEGALLGLHIIQRLTYLCPGMRGADDIEPLLTRHLTRGGEYLDMIATLELAAQRHSTPVDTSASTGVAHLRMNAVGKIEHRSTLRKFIYIALGSEDKHLVVIELHLELVDGGRSLTFFKHRTNARKPVVHTSLALDALIPPMSRHTTFGHLIHAFGTYLHLDPFLFGTYDGDVQTLVSVGLRHAEPVTKALRIRLIHRRHDGEGLPALHLLLLDGAVEDDAYGEEVIDALEGALLLLHLLPDGVYGLCASLDMEIQSGLLQALLNRFYEALYVSIATGLSLVKFILDVVIGIVLGIFQRQVLQLRLQAIESQLMCQRSIERHTLFAHLAAQLVLLAVAYLTHQIQAVGNHDEDYTHILSQGEKQVAEILGLDDSTLAIELPDLFQATQDARHRLSEGIPLILLEIRGDRHKHYGNDRIAPDTYLTDGKPGCFEAH